LSASELHHSAGVDDPTPRGSKPTRSNRSRTDAGMLSTIPAAASIPDSPGPPGLTISDPIFAPVAGKRISARVASGPSGSA